MASTSKNRPTSGFSDFCLYALLNPIGGVEINILPSVWTCWGKWTVWRRRRPWPARRGRWGGRPGETFALARTKSEPMVILHVVADVSNFINYIFWHKTSPEAGLIWLQLGQSSRNQGWLRKKIKKQQTQKQMHNGPNASSFEMLIKLHSLILFGKGKEWLLTTVSNPCYNSSKSM